MFFETKMYPLFNEFEQKLRKILYLFAAKNYDSEKNTKENESSKKKGTEIADKIKISIKNINGLDKFEFGNIFQVLFVDDNMIADVQKYVGENKQQLSKKELIEKIEQAEEKTFWKDFIGDTAAITLQEMFNSVRLYRNDVMHTHNIRYDTYSKASKLIFKINNELEDEISRLLNSTNVFVKDDFNDRLISKINMLNQLYVGEIRIPSTYAPDNKLIGLKYDSINNQYIYTPSIISTKDKSEFSINSILNNYCNNGFTTIKYDNSDKIFTNKNIENCDKEDFLTLRVDRYGNVNIVPDETSNSK